MSVNKPPLGIEPTSIWMLRRVQDIERAIQDRMSSEFEIPVEWIEERNKIIKELISS